MFFFLFLLTTAQCLPDLQNFPPEDKYYNLQRFLTQESNFGLTTSQKQEIACTIGNELDISPERVYTSNGHYCGQIIPEEEIEQPEEQIEQDNDEEFFYDYWVIMPDVYAAEGNMEECVEVLESENFEKAVEVTLQNETLFGGENSISVKEIASVQIKNEAVEPIIDGPDYVVYGGNITFLFKGANNSNGFIFGGITEYDKQAPDKQQVQFIEKSDYQFEQYTKNFYQQEIQQNVSFIGLKECTQYVYYWLVSNEDPNSYQYSTELKDEIIMTQCFGEGVLKVLGMIGVWLGIALGF